LINSSKKSGIVLARALFAITCCLANSGCGVPKELAPIVAGEAGRVQLLQQSVSTLHKSLTWLDPAIAFEVVSPRIFPGYMQKMIGDPKNTKVMDVSSTEVALDPNDSFKATSVAEIRVFGAPSYSVRSLTRKEFWEFDRTAGWKLVSVEPV